MSSISGTLSRASCANETTPFGVEEIVDARTDAFDDRQVVVVLDVEARRTRRADIDDTRRRCGGRADQRVVMRGGGFTCRGFFGGAHRGRRVLAQPFRKQPVGEPAEQKPSTSHQKQQANRLIASLRKGPLAAPRILLLRAALTRCHLRWLADSASRPLPIVVAARYCPRTRHRTAARRTSPAARHGDAHAHSPHLRAANAASGPRSRAADAGRRACRPRAAPGSRPSAAAVRRQRRRIRGRARLARQALGDGARARIDRGRGSRKPAPDHARAGHRARRENGLDPAESDRARRRAHRARS